VLILADVEGLSEDHDKVFMSYNIEHWYSVLGPTKTAATKFLPISKPVALALVALHTTMEREGLSTDEIRARISTDKILSEAADQLQELIHVNGSFIKTSARSCKDIALQIGLMDRYGELLADEVSRNGREIDDMLLRALFMEAGRQVLRFKEATAFLVACVLSNRVTGVHCPL
jgi:hypothetical protein